MVKVSEGSFSNQPGRMHLKALYHTHLSLNCSTLAIHKKLHKDCIEMLRFFLKGNRILFSLIWVSVLENSCTCTLETFHVV